MQKAHVKQAARGQRQIHEENRSTLTTYLMVSLASTLLVASLNALVFVAGKWDWIGLTFAALFEASAVGFMFTMTKNVRNEKNQVVDAGLDLNDPGAFGEYCKDIVILAVLAQLLGLVSAYFYLLLLIVPGFGFFKLWTGILAPWFFAPAPEVDEEGAKKKQKKQREKIVYQRR